MDMIKESFAKVKGDIEFLKQEINNLKIDLSETRNSLVDICEIISRLTEKYNEINKEFLNKFDNKSNQKSSNNSIYLLDLPSFKSEFGSLDTSFDNQTNISTRNHSVQTNPTNISTPNLDFTSLNGQILGISKGNVGVQTDRQTDNQTDRRMEISSHNHKIKASVSSNESFQLTEKNMDLAIESLNSLDNLKKEIRLKFKRLTEQELLVFSTIYQLGDEIGYSDYKSLSKKLKLTESSIRDYVRRLISKDIPILKNKINNKEIKLSISPSLKKITSLNTILQLREL